MSDFDEIEGHFEEEQEGAHPPFTDLELTAEEEKRYLDLLIEFQDAQNNNHGAEEDVDATLDALALVDEFIRHVAKSRGIHTSNGVEALFNHQASNEALSIADYLDSISTRLAEGLQEAHEQNGRLGVMDFLKDGGAQVVETNAYLVRTDSEYGAIERGHGDNGKAINQPLNKFAALIMAVR